MLNNTIKLNIIFGLGILAILALVLMTLPTIASAYATYGGYITSAPITEPAQIVSNPKPVINSINPSSSNVGVGVKTITITGEGFIPSSVARVNGSNRTTTFIDNSRLLMQITGNDASKYISNGGFFITVFNPSPDGGYSNAVFFAVKNTGASSATTTGTANDTSTNWSDTTQTQNQNNADGNESNLASNAIFGVNGIIPSSLIQWIFFAILVLLIVILVRKIYGGSEKYNSTPLKHK